MEIHEMGLDRPDLQHSGSAVCQDWQNGTTRQNPEDLTCFSLHESHYAICQQYFREKVLLAYHHQCTLCSLKHPELLDAAHIIGDTEELGVPIVQNGLSLCKIHHAAFDQNIIGINPDYEIKIRTDILEEIDGPMLKHGIQALNNHQIILPTRQKDWPDKDRLDIRFNRFKTAG